MGSGDGSETRAVGGWGGVAEGPGSAEGDGPSGGGGVGASTGAACKTSTTGEEATTCSKTFFVVGLTAFFFFTIFLVVTFRTAFAFGLAAAFFTAFFAVFFFPATLAAFLVVAFFSVFFAGFFLAMCSILPTGHDPHASKKLLRPRYSRGELLSTERLKANFRTSIVAMHGRCGSLGGAALDRRRAILLPLP